MLPRLKPLITIVGTTGVGKLQLLVEIARAVGGEVINADLMQMYRGIPVVTNKHPEAERHGVPHHVMDHVGWDEEYYVHRFQQEALDRIADIHARGKVPVVVGGTHYYLQLILGTNHMIQDVVGAELTAEQKAVLESDLQTMWDRLAEADPVVAGKFHPNDSRKVKRALEVLYTTQQRALDIYQQQAQQAAAQLLLRFNTLVFWVYLEQQALDTRLDTRVDAMLARGLEEEIREMHRYYEQQNRDADQEDFDDGVWKVIGFKEFFPWVRLGTGIDDERFAAGVELMKQRTRKYARQQVKWIRKKLVVEMAREEAFGYANGGRVFLLDATDLAQWTERVGGRGVEISRRFVEGESLAAVARAPAQWAGLVAPPDATFTRENWKHHRCAVCEKHYHEDVVCVGSIQWDAHMGSRKHRRAMQGERKTRKQLWEERKREMEAAGSVPEST